MREQLPASLDGFMDDTRRRPEKWQDMTLAYYEVHLLNSGKYETDALYGSIRLDEVRDMLASLSQRYDVPVVPLEYGDGLDEESFAAAYDHVRNAVVVERDTEHLPRYAVTHEFAHYWLFYHFAFKYPGSASSVLTRHGGVFSRAYIQMLAEEFTLSIDELLAETKQVGLFVADTDAIELGREWLEIDFSVDSEVQRAAIIRLASLDAPAQE